MDIELSSGAGYLEIRNEEYDVRVIDCKKQSVDTYDTGKDDVYVITIKMIGVRKR